MAIDSLYAKLLAVKRVTQNTGKKDTGSGPHYLENSKTENTSSTSSEKKRVFSSTTQTYLYPQEKRKTKATWNTDYDGPKPTSTTPVRFRTSSRYPLRQELLWVQAKEIYP